MKHLGDYFDSGRMFTYIRGYAMAKKWSQTLHAMNFARKCHAEQKRKSGEPYIIHPLTMACQALAMGIDDDAIIAALLLHDVVEDCVVDGHYLTPEDLPVNEEVQEIVRLLTYDNRSFKPSLEKYYRDISNNPKASICKIIDRCNNVSSMSGVFNKDKLLKYIQETTQYIMPLLRSTKEKYPEYQNILFMLKYHIVSVLSSIEGAIEAYNTKTLIINNGDDYGCDFGL